MLDIDSGLKDSQKLLLKVGLAGHEYKISGLGGGQATSSFSRQSRSRARGRVLAMSTLTFRASRPGRPASESDRARQDRPWRGGPRSRPQHRGLASRSLVRPSCDRLSNVCANAVTTRPRHCCEGWYLDKERATASAEAASDDGTAKAGSMAPSMRQRTLPWRKRSCMIAVEVGSCGSV